MRPSALLFAALALADPLTAAAACFSPLRACITGVAVRSRMKQNKNYFSEVVAEENYDGSKCDVVLHMASNWSSVTEIFSAKTKKKVGSMGQTPEYVCRALIEGGALAREFDPGRKDAAAGSGLSADDIERIAKAVQGPAHAAPAAAAEALLPSPSPSFTAAERPDDLAIIIGVETYSDIASKASYAERDAAAFKAYVRALGVPERNIVLLKGAKAGKASLEKNLDAWLPRMAKPSSRVYFYFSGHGAPDVKSGQAYLVPWDGDPNFLAETAYPVAKLYKKLGALPAKQVLVAMDSCFSGAGGRSVLASGARPLVGKIDTGVAGGKITVLAASASNEISGSLDDKGHGAFTYFLLEGMNAGKTTPKALNEYLTPRVQDEARRLNRDQTPQLQGDGGWSLR